MGNRKSVFWMALVMLVIGLISLFTGTLLKYNSSPIRSVRQVWPGITFLLFGAVLLFLYFKYRKHKI